MQGQDLLHGALGRTACVLSSVEDHDDAVEHGRDQVVVGHDEHGCAVDDDAVVGLDLLVDQLPHGRAADQSGGAGRRRAADKDIEVLDGGGLDGLADTVEANQDVRQSDRVGDVEDARQDRAPEIGLDQKHALAGACHGDRKVRRHGGLAVAGAGACDQETPDRLIRGEQQVRPQLTERFRQQRVWRRMADQGEVRVERQPLVLRQVRDAREHGHADLPDDLRRRPQAGVHQFDEQAQADTEKKAEQDGRQRVQDDARL